MFNVGLRVAGIGRHRASGPSTPVFVQQRTIVGTNSLAYNSPVTAGNLLIVYVGGFGGGFSPTISDTVGTFSSTSPIAINTAGGAPTAAFIGIVPSGGANTITASGYVSFPTLSIMEFSSCLALLDGSAVLAGSGVGSVSITTTLANALVVFGGNGFHNGTTYAAGAGFTLEPYNSQGSGGSDVTTNGWSNGNDAMGVEYMIQAIAANVTAALSVGSGDNTAFIALAIKAA